MIDSIRTKQHEKEKQMKIAKKTKKADQHSNFWERKMLKKMSLMMFDFFESLDHAFVDVFLFSHCINVASFFFEFHFAVYSSCSTSVSSFFFLLCSFQTRFLMSVRVSLKVVNRLIIWIFDLVWQHSFSSSLVFSLFRFESYRKHWCLMTAVKIYISSRFSRIRDQLHFASHFEWWELFLVEISSC
jgi:hypothetical protein